MSTSGLVQALAGAGRAVIATVDRRWVEVVR
jgi:hypothetical protein